MSSIAAIARGAQADGVDERNRSALTAELARLHTRSFGWALACCGWDHAEAEDVLQTAYLKALDGRARFGGRSLLSTWLYGVIRRTAAERRRAQLRRRIVGLGEAPQAAPVGVEGEGAADAAWLRRALDGLPRRQREVLHLVFYQDLSIREAGEVMGVSLGTARAHYERGKRRLRERLKGGGHR